MKKVLVLLAILLMSVLIVNNIASGAGEPKMVIVVGEVELGANGKLPTLKADGSMCGFYPYTSSLRAITILGDSGHICKVYGHRMMEVSGREICSICQMKTFIPKTHNIKEDGAHGRPQ